MRKSFTWITLVLAVVLCTGVAHSFAANGERKDAKTQVVYSDKEPAEEGGAVKCTISAYPNKVSNGQAFDLWISYEPCQKGQFYETFTVSWSSSSPAFGETTTRTKASSSTQCVGSSGVTVAAPGATFITGPALIGVQAQGDGFDCFANSTVLVD